MSFTRKEVEDQINAASAAAKAIEADLQGKVVKKSPKWREAKAEIKHWQKRLKAIQKLEEREAGLKKA